MTDQHVTQIPFPGNSGATPTGAMQFAGDWPGLFIRGDDAIMLMCSIHQLSERLSENPDVIVASALSRLGRYAEIIDQLVIVRNEQRE
jgi:hypothetical protein